MAGPSETSVFGVGGIPEPGPIGPIGPAGPPNILTIGTVTQGITAAATITGTSPAQVLSLQLPEGPQGPRGLPGEAGGSAALGIGSVTSGTPAAASITGTAPNQVLNLVLPQGATGQTGPAGSFSSSLLSRTTDQTVTVWPVKVEWQTAVQDTTGTWSAANATRLIVPAGFTRVTVEAQGSVTSEEAAGSMSLELLKNGSPMAPRIFVTNGRAGAVGAQENVANLSSYVIPVVAGDYLELQANREDLTATTITAALSWLCAQFY